VKFSADPGRFEGQNFPVPKLWKPALRATTL